MTLNILRNACLAALILLILQLSHGAAAQAAGNETSNATSTVTGKIYGWGLNWSGSLGDGTLKKRATPSAVLSDQNYTLVVTQGDHSCALFSNGRTQCWGLNRDFQLGVGRREEFVLSPDTVPTTLRFTSLAVGNIHTCGVADNGRAYCWGGNPFGEVGDGFRTRRPSPVAVATNTRFTAITAGYDHTCALATTGSVMCWGSNVDGQLGTGRMGGGFPKPVAVKSSIRFSIVVASTYGSFTCGLERKTGKAFCWGANYEGQLGTGNTVGRSAPTAVNTRFTFTQLAAGMNHACGLTPTGAAFCWGMNAFGQLGDGTGTSRFVPTRVSATQPFTLLAAGGSHTCGITATGEAYCWGANKALRIPGPWGALGDGSGGDRRLPTLVAGGILFKQLACGFTNTLGLAA